jgi:hypothetical protein
MPSLGVHTGNFPTLSLATVSGNFTPGAAFTIDSIVKVGNWCAKVAQYCLENEGATIEEAMAALGDVPHIDGIIPNPLPNIIEPNVAIPEYAPDSEILEVAARFKDLIDKLVPLFVNYMTTYFPLNNVTGSKSELWIHSVIDGGRGVNAAVEAAFWERDRARISLEAGRAEADALATFAGRGFMLPPGTALAMARGVRENAARDMSASSREIAIKQYEVEIQMVQFAIEQAITLRKLAMESAVAYINALASSAASAGEMFEKQNDGQSKLINAAAAFYNARSHAQEILWKAKLAQAEISNDASKSNQETDTAYAKAKAELAAQDAASLAQAFASAVNNLQLNTGTSYTSGSAAD